VAETKTILPSLTSCLLSSQEEGSQVTYQLGGDTGAQVLSELQEGNFSLNFEASTVAAVSFHLKNIS